MGTLNFTVGKYAKQRGSGASTLASTDIRTSDAFTTSASATNVEDGSGDITLRAGEVFRCNPTENMWIRFGGNAAAVGSGWLIEANKEYEWECGTPGTVSVIDVA